METAFISPEMMQDLYAMTGLKDPKDFLEKEYLRRYKEHLAIKILEDECFGACEASHKGTVLIHAKLKLDQIPPYEIQFEKLK